MNSTGCAGAMSAAVFLLARGRPRLRKTWRQGRGGVVAVSLELGESGSAMHMRPAVPVTRSPAAGPVGVTARYQPVLT